MPTTQFSQREPPSDIVILLIGLPLIAAIGGWLSAGREAQAISRPPHD
jgi:hypothetical protein